MSATDRTSAACDFCGTPFDAPAYIPQGTRRGVAVHVCAGCGLVQSVCTKREPQRIKTLSTDADWGNVRHGKGVRFPFLRDMLERHVAWPEVARAIDIGSNRGDFVLWLAKQHQRVETWAVEPDSSVTGSYAELPGLRLFQQRLEHVELPAEHFDLAFCSHTLEHADSGAGMLETMRRVLRPGGLLLLEIPNLAGICDADVVEEFFIDKHTLHFDRETLLDYLGNSGFEVLVGADDDDPLSISLLLRRAGAKTSFHPRDGASRATRNRAWIASFADRLPRNRALLQRIVNDKLQPLGKRQKVGYWGAGRIFDALVNYGGLHATDIHCLVDSHLHGIVRETHGVLIERPEDLRIREPQVLVALGRSAEELMARKAYAMGIRHVVKFSELMGQARDLR